MTIGPMGVYAEPLGLISQFEREVMLERQHEHVAKAKSEGK